MKQSEFGWTAEDGLHIHAVEWMPEDRKALGVVCLVHGFGEHSGRYRHVAKHLSGAGFSILAPDLRGHGRSGGKRGHTPGYGALMDDLSRLLDEAERRYPDIPRFLYGHSMGGNLALNYPLRHHPRLNGVISTSPWLRLTSPPPAITIGLARIINLFLPSSSRSNNLDAGNLSHDPAVARNYNSDPLVNRSISTRLFLSINDAGEWALNNAENFSLPLLIMHGGADPITSPEASRRFAGKVREDCTLKIWDGLFHETHNEPVYRDILNYLEGWLTSHL